MSNSAASLPDDPTLLKAMIAALQAENEKMSASLRAHDLLVQALRARIAKLQKQMGWMAPAPGVAMRHTAGVRTRN